MWHGVAEYLFVVAVIALVAHSLCRCYFACVMIASFICSIFNILHESWIANWQVNLGWGPFLLSAGFFLALPVTAAVGLPFLLFRRIRQRNSNESM